MKKFFGKISRKLRGFKKGVKERFINKTSRKKIIFGIILFSVLTSIFIVYRMRLEPEESKKEVDIVKQKSELDMIKAERGYVDPTDEEIKSQVNELKALREKAKEEENDEK